MKFSIVVPSFNQAQYLEDCLDSILMQRGVEKEIIVMDGGSTDGSVDIIRRYEPHLAFWQSQPDGGQSAAINAGFSRATGEVYGWLNSDDYFLPGTLVRVAAHLGDMATGFVSGGSILLRMRDGCAREYCSHLYADRDLSIWCWISQPSTFWAASEWATLGPLITERHYSMDWEWWLRSRRLGRPWRIVSDVFSVWRIHRGHKMSSGDDRIGREWRSLRHEYQEGAVRTARETIESDWGSICRIFVWCRRFHRDPTRLLLRYLRRQNPNCRNIDLLDLLYEAGIRLTATGRNEFTEHGETS